jgi:membrane fusion protein (multidrug efflux system)
MAEYRQAFTVYRCMPDGLLVISITSTTAPMPAQLKRRLLIFLLIVADRRGFFAHWFFKGRFYESTDNAYVQGEITRVSSQLARASTRCWSGQPARQKASCW